MGKYDFVSLDCEKANNEATSLCSIGIACFKDGRVVKQKEYIIKPVPCSFYKGIEKTGKETYHKIPLQMYKNACTFKELWPRVKKLIDGEILAGHGINGDFLSIKSILNHYGIEWDIPENDRFICTNIASIYTYPECESHKLGALCQYLDIPIKPHHALSDAKAAGYLLLEMLNDTDCSTVAEFIDVCNKYNEIITERYTERNIEKYEQEVLEMFNFNSVEIELIKKNQAGFCQKIISFFKDRQGEDYVLPEIEIITCLTPIIEISKNEEYAKYFSSLSDCRPFNKDGLLFIKGESGYLVFVGVLVDKIELIRNMFALLARDSIKIDSGNKYECIYRNFYKHLMAADLLAEYLYIDEDFEEYEVYEFIEYFFNTEVEISKGFEYNKDYNMMFKIPEYEESYAKYLKIVKERMQLVAIYASLQKNFSLFSSGLKIPNNIFSRDTNLLLDLYNIFEHIDRKDQVSEITYAINRWYNRNVF